MKRLIIPYTSFGIAAGLAVWFLHELLLFTVYNGLIPETLTNTLSGGAVGLSAGAIILFMAGFFHGNGILIRKGLIFGAIFGLVGGLISFFVIDLIIIKIEFVAANWLFSNLLFVLRWVVLALFIGVALGIRDGNELIMIRGLVSTAIAGSIGGSAITISTSMVSSSFWSRGIGYIVLLTVLTLSIPYFSKLGRKIWIKALNGKLEGLEFEMFKDIHYFGTQSDDDINLRSYEDIRPTHAKLIKYYSGYSLVDNDPFWQTYVNFRNIKEQPLKNGDIIKIGKALFQYCTVS